MAATQRFLSDPPMEGHKGPFPTEAGALPGENEEDEYLFLVSLDAFHDKSSGHRLNSTGFKLPTSFGTPLNLPKLYREVCSLGGYDNVTECKLWKPVTNAFNLPATATSASTQFRLYYEKLLLAYEDRYFHGQKMRGVTRKLGTGWTDGGGGAGESGGSGNGSGPRGLKRTASDAGVTSARQGAPKKPAQAKPAAPAAAPLASPGGAPPPPPWTQGLNPTQQGAALLSLLQPSAGPYLVVPPGFEADALPRVRLALFGGVRAELAWALNCLAVLSYDARPGHELRVTAMPGLLDVLVACLGRAAEAPDAASGALALAAALPRRPGPALGGAPDADVARAAAALEASVALGVLPSPLSDDAVAAAAAAAAAACILRNVSFFRANVPALLAAGKPVAQAMHLLRAEAQAAERPQEPDPASSRSLEDDAAAAERGAMCGDLMDMLLNLAHAVQLTPHPAQPGGAGGGAGGSVGVDHTPARFAMAALVALQSCALRRAAAGAELVCRLCTQANAAGFRPGGAFADTGALLPPLLRLLKARSADADAAALAAAALAHLVEVPEYAQALGALPAAAEELVAAALDADMPELGQRSALATLHGLLKLPLPPRPPALLKAERALARLAAEAKEDVARVAARVLRSPVFNSGVYLLQG